MDDELIRRSVASFVEATAARTTTPGGGSVAGVVGALAAALGEMAVGFTRDKAKFAAHADDYARLGERLPRARAMLLELVAEDVNAFELYSDAMKAEGPARQDAVQLALAACIDVPREMAKIALAILDDLALLSDRCTKWLLSDLAAGAILAEAVVKLCDYNVRVNAGACADRRIGGEVAASSADDCRKARHLLERIEAQVQAKLEGP
ncbi:MAG: cyclodeaminase/cyclohydrolase family protein [Planctomycetes bacterium]|nr:cyclodeaminase/cyclohydrolase family protein [Planctomycetota bacterium]